MPPPQSSAIAWQTDAVGAMGTANGEWVRWVQRMLNTDSPNILNLQLGFSHDTSYEIPKDVKIVVEKGTLIKISGINKELIGKVASEIKMLKPVEPYKGKGIKERGQYVLRKEGKKK